MIPPTGCFWQNLCIRTFWNLMFFFGLSFRVFVLRFFWNSPRGCFSQKWNISISGLFTIVLFETYWSFFEVPPWLCFWEYTFWLLLECTCATKCNFLPLHPRVFENVCAFWHNTHPPGVYKELVTKEDAFLNPFCDWNSCFSQHILRPKFVPFLLVFWVIFLNFVTG